MMRRFSLPARAVAAAILVNLIASWGVAAEDELREEARALFGVLEPVPGADPDSPQVALGRALFWDKRVSADRLTACANCHAAADWGADRRRFSLDARGKNTARNSQTVFNAMLQPFLRWTGDRTSGSHQAERSLTGSMGFGDAGAGVAVLKELGYQEAFVKAYPGDGEAVTPANYAKALQAYQETLITPAPLDRFLSGEDGALTERQRAGLSVFIAIGCSDCHGGPLLGGRLIRKFGVEKEYWTATGSEKRDAGLFETTKAEEDRYKFRVSMLRNVAKTAPYFHDGSVAGLEEAVQVMAEVQHGNRLSADDAASVAAFLESLTGDVPDHYGPPNEP